GNIVASTVLENSGTIREFCGSTFTGIISGTAPIIIPCITTTTLSSSTNQLFYGDTVTFTAMVSPTPNGVFTVTFFDGITQIGADILSVTGAANFSTDLLDVGSHSITAVFAGNAGYTASTSNPITITVDPTITILLSDGPSCVAIGGTWDGANTCTVQFLMINPGEILDIANGINLVNLGTIDNDFGINNLGTITNIGTIDNFGDINNSGTITNIGTINNHCDAVITGNPPSGNPVNNVPCAILYCDKTIDQFASVIDGDANNNVIVGTLGDDLIDGLGGDDRIWGKSGDDCIFGGEGNDYLVGGAGNDEIDGENGNDKIWGQLGMDILYGSFGNDRIAGGADNDSIFGEENNDYLWGQAGDDTLDGGTETDVCVGGIGTNTITNCE
ncbi:MAG: domain containing protein, partial [Candidatus Nitrosotenuis sp.]|nr:domain containing protein [Candidatus Nitrosotenuis sp.]